MSNPAATAIQRIRTKRLQKPFRGGARDLEPTQNGGITDFQTGERLGSYEIVGPLFAGGMGQVYRARDVRLSRTVARRRPSVGPDQHSPACRVNPRLSALAMLMLEKLPHARPSMVAGASELHRAHATAAYLVFGAHSHLWRSPRSTPAMTRRKRS